MALNRRPGPNTRLLARALHDLDVHNGRVALSWPDLESESQETYYDDAMYLVKRASVLVVNATTVRVGTLNNTPTQLRGYLRRVARGTDD
jgi:hypothetical protein